VMAIRRSGVCPLSPQPTQSALVDRLDPGSHTLLETSVWSSTGEPTLCSDEMPSGCKHACLWLAQQPFSDPDISLSHVSTLSLNLLRSRISSSHSLFAGPYLPFRPTQRPWTDLASSFLEPQTQSRSPGVTQKYPRPHLHQIGQL